jgi:hypothetical protein
MKKRVKLPANSKQLLDLAKQVQQKHVADGEASPLHALNWEAAGPLIDKVYAEHEKAQRLRREMRQAYQQRNLEIEAVRDVVRGCRDVLTGRYFREMRTLGEWGFDVFDNRQTTKDPTQEPMAKATV